MMWLRRRFKTCLIRFPIAPLNWVRNSHIGRKRAERTGQDESSTLASIYGHFVFSALWSPPVSGCRLQGWGGARISDITLYTPRSHSFSHCCNQPTRCVLHYKSISALNKLPFAFRITFSLFGDVTWHNF